MFLTGSTKALKQPRQETLGISPARAVTHEAARPLPVFYGTRRLGVTWLSQRFNVRHKKKKSKKGGSQKRYFSAFAALAGAGPVDKISAVYLDGVKSWEPDPEVWDGTRDKTRDKIVAVHVVSPGAGYSSDATVTFASGTATARLVIDDGKITDVIMTAQGSGYDPENPPAANIVDAGGSGAQLEVVIGPETFVPIEIEGVGTWRFYWGVEDCDYDPLLLELSATARNPLEGRVIEGNPVEEHPAYCGQCYLVAIDQLLGTSRTTVQQIEVVVSRWPSLPWNSSYNSDRDGDCCLAAVLADGWTNSRYGLGISADRLDSDGWDAFAAVLLGEGLAVSPLFDSVDTFRTWLLKALEYVDGYACHTPAGKLNLGLIRAVECKPGDPDTPYYDEGCLTRVPEFEPSAWEDTVSDVEVVFTNRDADYNPDSLPGNNSANLAVTGEPSTEVLQRPWFTSPGVVDAYARAAAQIMGTPRQRGKIWIRKPRAQGLQIGGIFKLSWAHYSLCFLWGRCVSIAQPDPYTPELEIEFEVDRGFLSQRVATPPAYQPPTRITPQPEGFAQALVLELPYTPEQREVPYLAILAARPNNLTSSFAVHHVAGDVSEELGSIETFAQIGTLDEQMLPGESGPFVVTLTGVETELDDDLANLRADAFLMLIDDEIFSVTTVVLVDAATKQYSLTVLRERYDTKRQTHEAGALAWLISAADLKQCTLPAGKWSTAADETVSFKLQPIVLGSGYDLSEIDPVSATYTDRAKRHWKPRELTVNGTRWYAGNASYSTGADIEVDWTPVNRNGALWEGDLSDLWWIEIRTLDDVVTATYTAAADDTALTVTNAQLVAALGSETDFKVRIYARQGPDISPIASRYYDEITVNLI